MTNPEGKPPREGGGGTIRDACADEGANGTPPPDRTQARRLDSGFRRNDDGGPAPRPGPGQTGTEQGRHS